MIGGDRGPALLHRKQARLAVGQYTEFGTLWRVCAGPHGATPIISFMQVQIQIVCNRVFDDLNHMVEILEQYRNACVIQYLNHHKEALKIAEHLGWIAFEGCR
jgi:hypothetical protein